MKTLKLQEDVTNDLAERLRTWLKVVPALEHPPVSLDVDAIADVLGTMWLIRYKKSSESLPVRSALAELTAAHQQHPDAVPLLVVPFMGPLGARLCEEASVSWLDRSGNARINAPGLVVDIGGKRNAFPQPGRTGDLFAPKSSRVLRALLSSAAPMTRVQICRDTDLDDSFVSKIVKKLLEESLVVENADRALVVLNRRSLVDAWRAEHTFGGSEVRRFKPAMIGPDDLRAFANHCGEKGIKYAMTGAAAAELRTGVHADRLAAYVRAQDFGKVLDAFEADDDGLLTVAVPLDDGVFAGACPFDNVAVVAPVQALLDLDSDAKPRARAALEALVYGQHDTARGPS